MPEANDQQMQQFANERLRVRAEQFRDLLAACQDDISAIDDVYARAIGTSQWNDSRVDGPPHLLKSGNSSSPDDMLEFNTFINLFVKFMNGTFSDISEANSAAGNWSVLVDACVRPINR